MYPLDQCNTCSHRNVCKLIEEIEVMQMSYPIDFSTASCKEYTYDMTDFNINLRDYPMLDPFKDETLGNLVEIDGEYYSATKLPIENSNFNELLAEFYDKGMKVEKVYMNSDTMGQLFAGEEFHIIMYRDDMIKVEIDENLGDNMFAFIYEEGEE